MSESRYQKITELLTALSRDNTDIEKLRLRWLHWVERFGVYDHINKKRYVGFFAWQQDKKLINQEEKFLAALNALFELKHQSTNDFPNKDEIINTISSLAETDLHKLELRQSRKLKKIQNLARGDLKKEMEAFRDKRSKLVDEVRNKNYSQQIPEDQHLIFTQTLLKYHEQKFRWSKFIENAEHVSAGAKATKLGNFAFYVVNFFPNMLHTVAPPLITLGHSISTFLNGIPIVANIVSAIPIVFAAIKSWFKNKSTTKKVINSIAAGLAIAGIVAASVFLGLGLLTLGGFVGAGLAIVGFVALQLIPWARSMYKLVQARIEREKTIERMQFLQDKPLVSLTEAEKDILLKRIEDAWIHNEFGIKTSMDSQVIDAAKELIADGTDINKLKANLLIQRILENKTPLRLEQFLLDEHEQKKVYLTEHIKELKIVEREKAIGMSTSLLAVIGAVLICIPTPPTMIIGSALLLGTAIVGFGIKYKWGEKIANLFNRIFSGKTETPEVVTNEHKSDYKLAKEFAKAPEASPTRIAFIEAAKENPTATHQVEPTPQPALATQTDDDSKSEEEHKGAVKKIP